MGVLYEDWFRSVSARFIVTSGRTFIHILSKVLLSLPGLAWMGVDTDSVCASPSVVLSTCVCTCSVC